jgi:amino acid adenylation domain-containing protein/thioester reductase-like protein
MNPPNLHNHSQLDDEVESAFSEIHGYSNGHTRLASQITVVFDADIPSTHLPTLVNGCGAKTCCLGMAKSLSYASIGTSKSVAEQQNVLINSWAVLLHLYTVSDSIAFAVIGNKSDPTDMISKATTQLVVSRWSSDSSGKLYSGSPQLTYSSFIVSDHGNKVNTAVSFADIHQNNHGYSYILHWSEQGAEGLRLYTQQPSVPYKFASALWNTFLEVSMSIRGTDSRNVLKRPISRGDHRAIQSFMPAPLYVGRTCLHHLFSDSVRTAPYATAVQAWDGSFTYAELDSISDSVARQIVRAGVRSGQNVPFSFEKSKWMVVALIAILKAGGAFVPIDPSQPEARAREICRETHANVVVVSPSQTWRFAKSVETVVQISSEIMMTFDMEVRSNSALPLVQPEDPALILFTSGSTGRPKGIIVEHGAISGRVVSEGRAFQYQGARTLQFAASTWDIFITDIFTTLTFQGCICVPSEDDRRFNLSKFCTDYSVSLALITPTLANLLDPATFPTIKTLIFGGEALRQDVVQKWATRDGISLYQGYGPAETGPCVAGRVSDRPEVLGYALDNSICMLVDPNNCDRLVPLGAVGELVVGGSSLLREYINNPAKTDDAVIENPAWAIDIDTPTRRFCKTGDLLRYSIDTLDGRLEFIGRTDNQIKYHGQRIELGEVEHHLNALPGIVESMVTLVKEGYFKDKLVAIVQCEKHSSNYAMRAKLSIRQNASVTLADVKHFLSPRLPQYMIPNELLVVNEMPHTPSLKLDRALVNKWISAMHNMDSDSLTTSSGPIQNNRLLAHESTARTLAREYARIVAGDDVSRRKAFEGMDFNLQSSGIDSIQIMTLHAYVKTKYNVQVPMADMISSKSTVRSIASIVDGDKSNEAKLIEQDPLPNNHDAVTVRLKSTSSALDQNHHGSEIRGIFLTGASGFLGIEILRQLLIGSQVHVYALIRGSSQADAERRLIQKATAAGWWQDGLISRLHVWLGDLSQLQLGLTEHQWQTIQGRTSMDIDAIIHNGAIVHYNLDYDSVKATNVSSTVELLKAVNARKQPLASFVFVSGGQQLSFDARDDAKHAERAITGSGYAHSKAVSELVVKRFAEQRESRAKNVCVVKPGFIVGDSERGVANQADCIWRLVAASVEIGCYNEEDAESWIFITDKTRVSQLVLRSVFGEDCEPVTKVLDGMRVKELWSLLRDKFDYYLQPLSRRQWLSRIRQDVAVKQDKHVMFPLMYMLEALDEPIGVENGPCESTPGVQAAIRANIEYLIDIGFLPKPALVNMPTSSLGVLAPGNDALDIRSIREHFPALGQGIIPFNNAAGTVMHRGAAENALKYMHSFPIELGHDDLASRKKTQQLDDIYKELSGFVNASADEIGKSLKISTGGFNDLVLSPS